MEISIVFFIKHVSLKCSFSRHFFSLVCMIKWDVYVAGASSLRPTQRSLRRWVRVQWSWLLTPNHQQAVYASPARWQSGCRSQTGCRQSSACWRLVSVAAGLTLLLPLPHPHCFPTNSHLCCCSPILNLPLPTFTLMSPCHQATRRVTVQDVTFRQHQNWSASWKTRALLLLFCRYRTQVPVAHLQTSRQSFPLATCSAVFGGLES